METILHQRIVIDDEEFFEIVDPFEIYKKLRTGEVTPKDIYVRKVRAHTQPLPYISSEKRTNSKGVIFDPGSGKHFYIIITDRDIIYNERSKCFYKQKNDRSNLEIMPKGEFLEVDGQYHYFIGDRHYEAIEYSHSHPPSLYRVTKSRTSETAQLKQGIFVDREQGETLALGQQTGLLHFDVAPDEFSQRILSKIKSPDYIISAIATAKREIDQTLEEEDRKAKEQYILKAVKPDLDKYHEKKAALQLEAEHKLCETAAIIMETSQRAGILLERSSLSGKIKTKMRLPQAGFEFDITFNHGQFQSLQELLDEAASLEK